MFLEGCAFQNRPGPDRPRAVDESPERFFWFLHSKRLSRGEARLALAVLEDAVGCLDGKHEPWKIPPRLFRWEAEQWIGSGDRASLFSFENVCAMLRLDARALRRRIQRWSARHNEITREPA